MWATDAPDEEGYKDQAVSDYESDLRNGERKSMVPIARTVHVDLINRYKWPWLFVINCFQMLNSGTRKWQENIDQVRAGLSSMVWHMERQESISWGCAEIMVLLWSGYRSGNSLPGGGIGPKHMGELLLWIEAGKNVLMLLPEVGGGKNARWSNIQNRNQGSG